MLQHFDLTIPAGSSLAIVGQNGAGKTTIAKLLCRLYDPQSGAIEIDGIDLRDFDLASWRTRITAVFQDFLRLELPLRENVALRARSARRCRARRARIGGSSGTWPRSTPCWPAATPGGTDLSGGQWQRVALARALAAVTLGAGVVLLDEPTAQLDVRGEAEIFDRLLAATRHCTTILISHRFSTVRHADRICVLEQGRVVELGTHDELMALGGRYRTMFDLQAQRFHFPKRRAPPMKPSPNRTKAEIDPLPPALSSMWRLCKLGYRHEPRLMLASFVLSQLAALPDALLALWLWLLGKGFLEHRTGLMQGAAVGLGVSATATWFLRTVSTRVQRRFRDKVTIALESHVARLQATVATVAHHERPEYLDRLSMLRNQVFVLDHMYMSLFSTLGWILRLGVTMALLASIHPALLLLAVFAIPTVLTSAWRPQVERIAQERGAQAGRLARHLFTIATTAPPGKEVRVTGIGERLVTRPPGGVGAVVRAGGGGALGLCVLAGAGMGDFRPGVCGRGGLRLLLSQSARQRGAAGAGRRSAAVGVHRRDRGRDRIPARILDGRFAAAGLARGLCRLGRGRGRSAGSRGIASRGALRPRFLRLPGHLARGAGRRVGVAAGGRGGRDCGRERRRQDNAGQAAGEDVRAVVGCDPGGRHAAGAPAGRRVACDALRARSRISSASNSAPGTRSAWAMSRAWTTRLR